MILRRRFRHLTYALAAMSAAACVGSFSSADPVSPKPSGAGTTGEIRFNRDIRPILSDNCFACHGPDSARRKAGLRLDREEGLFGKSDNGRPVVKRDLKQSMIVERMDSADPDEVMPPPNSHKSLTAEQKTLIKRWIEQGAPWEPHWSLTAPARPAVPAVKQQAWVRNPIDAFVLHRLESEGLSPAPEADRRTLIRRLSFDLTGLPPKAEEVEAFVADKSPDAYEKLVDHLMSTVQWGEHRGRYWLDAARYADTHGIHNDNYREMWPYRDWVINAFNANLPFDKFVVEQIAGDILPGRSMDQQIASGFHRCNATTSEGGSIAEEVDAIYVKDRVETTGTVFLGLTAGCASCHDHKFDPISQKEFYQLAAFFKNTTQPAMDGNVPNTPPVIVVPSAADRPEWDRLQKRLAELTESRDKLKAEKLKAFEKWARSDEAKSLRQPIDPTDEVISLPLNGDENGNIPAFRHGDAASLPIANGLKWGDGPAKDKAIQFDAKASLSIPDAGDFEADQPFTVSAWVFVPQDAGNFQVLGKIGTKPANGWALEINSNLPSFRLAGKDAKEKLEVRANGSTRVAGGKWAHLLVTYNGSRRHSGLTLYIDGKAQPPVKTDDAKFAGSIRNDAPLRLGGDQRKDFKGGALQDVRILRRAVSADEATVLSKWTKLQRNLARGDGKFAGGEKQELELLYLNRLDPQYRQISAELATTDSAQRVIRDRSPVTHVMQEKAGSKPMANVLFRGQYDQKREAVEPATPAALHAYRADWPKDRLGLAWWIVDPANPLTARVTVNRFWQELFGQGIVRTSEDFGIMGENPSNPQLLDWLAVEFREPTFGRGEKTPWDIKRFYRLLVTSATYRQSAAATPEKLAKDPNNRLLSRGPRFRMDAEVLRDFALGSSGLLVDKVGGPSVKPYQPQGVWEAVAMFGSNTRFYKPDAGEGLYRRSLYTFWKRSAPPSAMDIFNAPSRLVCTVRRERTNTPLQALATMNDPQWVEAARRLAERTIVAIPADDFDKRLDYLTVRLLARPFEPKERQICRGVVDELLKTYNAQPEAAKKLISTGESKPDDKLPPADLAAWTMLASQLMNTDEALNK